MKKWQKNPWQVPNCIPPYDVVELDEKGKTIFSHSYRRFEDAWARFVKSPSSENGWVEFRRLNKTDADMTVVCTNTKKYGIQNVVEWRNLDKVGKEKI